MGVVWFVLSLTCINVYSIKVGDDLVIVLNYQTDDYACLCHW